MISILCPTRKRPVQFERMVESARITATSPIEILARFDADDTESARATLELPVNRIIGPRVNFADNWNELAERASGDLLGLFADDVVFQTSGWSAMVEQAFADCPDKILLVHGDDLGFGGNGFGTLPFISRKWMETVGYFCPSGYSGDFLDTHLNDVANLIGRRKFLSFVTEHMHHLYGKSERDETYREKDERMNRDGTREAYEKRLPERLRDAEKLRAVML